jgi:tetratricopeptide (TPR) repeat protein
MTQRIIFNAIFKEEDVNVVGRCLRSVLPIIDAFCILDTGSSPEILALITEVFKDKPGLLHQGVFTDFGDTRTRAIRLAERYVKDMGWEDDECYFYLMDADEELVIPEGWEMPIVSGNLLGFIMKLGDVAYPRPNFISAKGNFRYEGVIHEMLKSDGDQGLYMIPGPYVRVRQEGLRSLDPERYAKDAETLLAAYGDDPNPRYLFYRGQALWGSGSYEAAIESYQAYIDSNDRPEETWYAKLRKARLLEDLKRKPEAILSYLDAYESRPWRMETLGSLSSFFRDNGAPNLAWVFSSVGKDMEYSKDLLFVEIPWYEGKILDEHAMNCFQTHRFAECATTLTKRLEFPFESDGEKDCVLKNLETSINLAKATEEAEKNTKNTGKDLLGGKNETV